MFQQKDVKKSQLIATIKNHMAYMTPRVKAYLTCKDSGFLSESPYVFDIKFDYQNQRQIEAMARKYNLANNHIGHYFYSYDENVVDGVVITSQEILNQLLSEFIEKDHIDVMVGDTMIGGKYDQEARKIVAMNIAEMKNPSIQQRTNIAERGL